MRSTIALIALGASAIAFGNNDHSSQHRRLARAAKSSSAVLEGSLTSDEGCSAFYTPKKATSVAALLKKTSLTEAGLRNANPGLKKVAPAGKSICVAGPTDLQFGSTDLDGGCTEFVEVESGDTCIKIADAHNVSLDRFLALNPGAGADCLTLWAGYSSCLVGGGLTESTVDSNNSTAILDHVKHEHGSSTTSTHHSSSHSTTSSHHRTSTSHARIHTTHRTTHAAAKPKETHKAAAKKEKAKSDDDDDHNSSVKVKVSSSSSLSTGKVTFYGQGDGGVYCENTAGCTPSDDSMTIAVSPGILKGGSTCGKSVTISGVEGSKQYRICDECPECDDNHFDMTFAGVANILGSDWHNIGEGPCKYSLDF